MNNTQQMATQRPTAIALPTWADDPHCLALAERIAETLMQADENLIESPPNGRTTKAILD